MRKIEQLAAMCTLAVAAAATFTANAKTCTWIVQSGNWADSANWADGAVPEDGDSVELVGSGGGGTIQLQGGATAALAGILSANSSSGWTLTDGTVNWADGTVVLENAANFKIYAQLASSDTTTFVKRGAGSLFLYATNMALRCAFVVEGGRILPVDDLSFGVVPETLRADAITLRGGALFNGDGEPRHDRADARRHRGRPRVFCSAGPGYARRRLADHGERRRVCPPAKRRRAL